MINDRESQNKYRADVGQRPITNEQVKDKCIPSGVPAVPGDKDRSDSTKVTLEKHVDYHDRHHKGLRNTLATMSDLTKEALKKTID